MEGEDTRGTERGRKAKREKKMDEQYLIDQTVEYVKKRHESDSSGHDWPHVNRVWKSSIRIAEGEGANTLVVQLAALLHDIGDRKFTGAYENSSEEAESFLYSLGVDDSVRESVLDIINNMSFSSGIGKTIELSLEGKAVQDADRLDAIGAIGIARCFAAGASMGKEMHNPELKPVAFATSEEYNKSKSTSVNHFYEKLFHLKDKMNTGTAKQIAEGRHSFMEEYLERFLEECEGER